MPDSEAKKAWIAANTTNITVKLNHNGSIEELPLNEYLAGVVASEMPALFPEEALKAQAVAARTYTMKKIAAPPAAEHNGAAVCSNPAHCKAYAPLSETAAGWSSDAEEYTNKITRAVSETDGEILLYDGEPITAVFHSTSSGKTENASDVWGGNVPYLVSVKSPGEDSSPRYEDEKTLSPDEFKNIFSKKYPDAKYDTNPENWITSISRSDAGGVKSLSVAGITVKGSDVRSLFGLNSTNFTVSYTDGTVKIKTRGYGHGVGMSQYGARAMALEGKSYDEILMSYYSGVTLGKIREKTSS
ncbi:MAG: stage II sporulation protein D [Oscillospiraceae bacterium]|nr:stage II sporulation protein D [Oscillospiraceae bacterium]